MSTKTAIKSTARYAKRSAKGLVAYYACVTVGAFVIAQVTTNLGITVPLSRYAMGAIAFFVVGTLVFRRKVSIGRVARLAYKVMR